MRARDRRSIPAIAAAPIALALLLAGCIQTTPRTVKIGLVAPFEGRYREIGYQVIPAARLAIREWAVRAGANEVAIELVAYDDMGDPALAVEQAQKLAVDPDVAMVIGHWRDETTQAALPVYEQVGVPLITFSTQEVTHAPSVAHAPGVHNLAPSAEALNAAATQGGTDIITTPDAGLYQFYALGGQGISFVTGAAEPGDSAGAYWTPKRREAFTAGFKEGSLGAPPGLLSISAYEATWLAIREIAAMHGIEVDGTPVDAFEFDADGRRIDAPVYLYVWQDGQRKFVERLR
jgi:ABC-type branched-subunit amino acid transport system substrate-binding protein